MALFTSWKAMDAAAEAVRPRVAVPVLTQRDLPKPALVRRFAADEPTCLFATAGFFQGVDVPGPTLIQVVIDRLPFPRPDDPLLSARRELLGPSAFGQIDLPRAAMMLAQAAGRLIRTADDRGVVAVLDRRLGTASYRWDIVNALPPMRRTRHRGRGRGLPGRDQRPRCRFAAVSGGGEDRLGAARHLRGCRHDHPRLPGQPQRPVPPARRRPAARPSGAPRRGRRAAPSGRSC